MRHREDVLTFHWASRQNLSLSHTHTQTPQLFSSLLQVCPSYSIFPLALSLSLSLSHTYTQHTFLFTFGRSHKVLAKLFKVHRAHVSEQQLLLLCRQRVPKLKQMLLSKAGQLGLELSDVDARHDACLMSDERCCAYCDLKFLCCTPKQERRL